MAQIRCPMCGKPNPEEREVCQFCQARLKPLIINPPDSSEDWLKASSEDELDNQDNLNQPEAPDWLRSLRARDIPIEDSNQEKVRMDPAEWLRAGLDDPDLLGAQRPSSQDADWLADFRSGEPSVESEEAEALGQEEIQPTEQPNETDEIDSGIPEWLSGARLESAVEPSEPESPAINQTDDNLEPEWLAQLRAKRAIEEADELQEMGSDQSELPDWLNSDAPNSESGFEDISSAKTPSDNAPDWTSYFSEGSSSLGKEPESGAPKADDEEPLLPEEDLPDWLKETPEQAETPADIDQASKQTPPDLSAEDSPPWFANAPGKPIKPTDQLSQWLRLETNDQETTNDLPSEEILDWLKADDETLTPAQEASSLEEGNAAHEPPISSDELSNIAFDTARPIEAPDVSNRQADLEEAARDDEFAALKKELFESAGTQEPVTPSVDEGGLVPGAEPSWLVELREKMGNASEQTPPKVAPFSEDVEHELPAEELSGAELPDWLIDVHAQEAIEQIAEAAIPLDIEETGANETSAGLAQADLPPWLEAMRPVEAVAAAASDLVDERDHSLETAGPLAGIKGVLPAEADVMMAHKPGSFGLKLQATDMQRARADLLKELIQKETIAKPLPRKPAISSQRLLQIIVAATLILAVLSTLIIDTPIAKVPGFPLETGAVSELINSLSSPDRVLVAVDYQPSFSGEMEAAASTVMDHLMLRGVHIAFVSTHPSGPLQAERLVSIVNQRYGHTYGDEQIANLGYISGGNSGLLAFASNPRQLAAVTFDNGTNPWDGGVLEGVTHASDFSLTIVITESPDTARMWIEQYQPQLGAKPLIAVLSAQAQPIVRPYYEASPQQVQGIVSGTAGAAAYENLLGRVGIARSRWGAYSLGVLAACALIVLGGIINGLPILTNRMKRTKPGEVDQL